MFTFHKTLWTLFCHGILPSSCIRAEMGLGKTGGDNTQENGKQTPEVSLNISQLLYFTFLI